jgi:hypothetical protein
MVTYGAGVTVPCITWRHSHAALCISCGFRGPRVKHTGRRDDGSSLCADGGKGGWGAIPNPPPLYQSPPSWHERYMVA